VTWGIGRPGRGPVSATFACRPFEPCFRIVDGSGRSEMAPSALLSAAQVGTEVLAFAVSSV
jgi:hypothetical protein